MARQNSINNSLESLTIDPGASGDSFVQFDINATGEFRIGIDDDTSDAFKISQGSALGTNDTFVMTAAGENTKPLQPAFLAVIATQIDNVTGDGTSYTVVWDTEVFDQNSDFSSTAFTAPIVGRYRLEANLEIGALTTSFTTAIFNIVTSNRSYLFRSNPGSMMDATTNQTQLITFALADMDASDTASVTVAISGSTKTLDLTTNGSTDVRCWFSGNLEV